MARTVPLRVAKCTRRPTHEKRMLHCQRLEDAALPEAAAAAARFFQLRVTAGRAWQLRGVGRGGSRSGAALADTGGRDLAFAAHMSAIPTSATG